MALGDGAVIGDAGQSRDIQETIWFQGFVGDAGTGEPVNATYTVTARMYDAENGGASVWGPESHLATVITDGWFNIELGAIVGGLPAFDTPPYYLQLTIDGELLAPRLKLASVPSAFQSLGADDGLSLPWSGTYAGSGEAFSVTNSGPNSAGYFKIDNAGSSATAVYGSHNGSGAALLGWHTGNGPALRAVANGSGYAGKFEGAVVVTESLRVEGVAVMQGNAVVTDTIYVGEGFWFPEGAEAGYVLRSRDDWGNAEWGPPNVIDEHTESAIVVIGSAVTQYDDAQVSLTVPGPGYIVVSSSVQVLINHTVGTTDVLRMNHSTDPGDLGDEAHEVYESVHGVHPSCSEAMTCCVQSTHEVYSGGTYTYYLVGQMTSGQDGGDLFWFGQTTGIYYPYPMPVKSDEVEREKAARAEYQRP